jgi:hypothetical protein
MNYSCLLPRLCVGPFPPQGRTVADEGFDLLLLCAAELQEAGQHDYPGVEIWHCGYDDGPLSTELASILESLALDVAHAWNAGRRILITCALGLNRSVLVAALAYRWLSGCSGKHALEVARAARAGSLYNPSFARYLEELPPVSPPIRS